MSNTSQKHRNFVSEPIGNKSVNTLPGVGPVLGERFKTSGHPQAKNVLGEYLVRNESRPAFQNWMQNKVGANTKQSSDCYNGLREWRNEFI